MRRENEAEQNARAHRGRGSADAINIAKLPKPLTHKGEERGRLR
jgi:hypothetical protein